MNNNELLEWSSTQGHILTGDGKLNSVFIPNKDYYDYDLPHYLKSNNKLYDTFKKWYSSGYYNNLIAGTWNRPLFIGGWKESGGWDTDVYNVQTPSLFVDVRFPKALKPSRDPNHKFTNQELRELARQHCFAGYTVIKGNPPVATRHHAIDWNYHPDYPRARPNMWRIEAHPNRQTFKEWSVALDEHKQAIYMERWERMENSDGPFLSLYSKSKNRTAIICITGKHFGFAFDRNSKQLPKFNAKKGGCANLLDSVINEGNTNSHYKIKQLLSLIGGYGVISELGNPWIILRSTKPSLENTNFFSFNEIELQFSQNKLSSVTWNGEIWDVFDCSFSNEDLHKLFLLSPNSKL